VKPLRKIVLPVLVVAMAAAPARVFACATCYASHVDGSMADGANWAVLTLGIVVSAVLGAFLTFFIYIMRRSERLEAGKENLPAPAKV